MFSYDFYKLMHFLGLFMAFSSLGGQFAMALNDHDSKKPPARKWIGMVHGIGLLLVLVGGFGMLARLKLGFPVWSMMKVVIWVAFGGLGFLAARKKSLAGAIWLATLALGVLAAYLARSKSF